MLNTLLARLLGRKENPMEKETFIVVGLGNPGKEYAHTRHNVGFDVTDMLADRWHIALDKKKLGGMLCETTYDGKRVVVCQPQTYMNLSGECVSQLLSWYKAPLDHLIIIYDDIDLPLGRLRIRKSGSAGTHNGMRSIISHTPSQDFPRIRVGVGAKPEGWELVNWVLSHYQTPDDREAMQKAFTRAVDCIEDWIKNGAEHAMQTANRG